MNQKIMIIGHRGVCGYAPENTRCSFELCQSMGFKMTECDLRLTRDGEFMVFHDSQLDRTTNGSGPFQKYTAAELKKLDCGGWFAANYQGLTMLSFDELLQLVKGKLHLTVHLKDEKLGDDELRKIVSSIEKNQMATDINISSAFGNVLESVRRLAPGLATSILLEKGKADLESMRWCKESGIGYWCPNAADVRKELIQEAHRYGLIVRLWGLPSGDPRELVISLFQLFQDGVDGMTANFPDLVRNILQVREIYPNCEPKT
jgi:glycerophosphoryl diester phosphodiesterase